MDHYINVLIGKVKINIIVTTFLKGACIRDLIFLDRIEVLMDYSHKNRKSHLGFYEVNNVTRIIQYLFFVSKNTVLF